MAKLPVEIEKIIDQYGPTLNYTSKRRFFPEETSLMKW